ncbi:hypothetical protein LTR09_011429 [Extremus antarcticus]|uniref:Uncharacterized protein n=1 Tax=Extremus antarcticus TaxID=702011 RepID=A0AAJ0D683_9PEZI|nr:hypothetical protein LTR09_011429 [Extremus antarcticus]
MEVKYIVMLPLPSGSRPYLWPNPSSSDPITQPAEIVILAFEGVHDYVEVVPQEIWFTSREIGYRIEPLLARLPTWVYPFVVKYTELKVAVERISASMLTREPHVNPTAHVRFISWMPEFVPDANLHTANNPLQDLSYAVTSSLWQALKQHGVKIHLCLVQPLVCDFLLELLDEL